MRTFAGYGPGKRGSGTFVLRDGKWVPKAAHVRSVERAVDFSKGPITMYSEPLEGIGAVRAPRYDKDGFAVFKSARELENYEAASKDSKRPVTITREAWERK